MNATIFDIQRASFVDGPGIRTTVFFKGCHLRCKWCHNPESQNPHPEVMVHKNKCTGCGICAEVCPHHLAKCEMCGKCVVACPAGARQNYGYPKSIEEIVAEVKKDKAFYEASGGGVTVSGGECMLQIAALCQLLGQCRKNGIHTAVDTAFCVSWERIRAAMPHACLFLTDIKAIDSDLHKELTGVSNELILENIRRLAASGHDFWVRVPVIPGQNSGEMEKIAEFVRSLNRPDVPVELIPYHNMAGGKYASLGLETPLQDIQPPKKEEMDVFYRPFEGLKRVEYT